MKRTLSFCLAIVMMTFGGLVTNSYALDCQNLQNIAFGDDFDNGTRIGLETTSATPSDCKIIDLNATDPDYGNVYRMSFAKDSYRPDIRFKTSNIPTNLANNNCWILEFDFKTTSNGIWSLAPFMIKDSDSSAANFLMARFENGKIYVQNGDSLVETDKTYEKNKWYHLYLYMDCNSDSFTLKITDNETKTEQIAADGAAFKIASKTIYKLRINSPEATTLSPGEESGYLYFDNILVKTYDDLSLISSSISDGDTDFAIDDDITIEFSYNIASFDESGISVTTDDGETEMEYAVNKENNTLKISFESNMLDFEKTYSLVINEGCITDVFGQKNDAITINFTTIEECLICEIPHFETLSDALISFINENEINVISNAANYTSESKKVVLVVAVYADGKFEKNIFSDSINLLPKTKADLSVTVSDCEGKTLKAFCIDDLDNLELLSHGFGQIDENEYLRISNHSEGFISITDVDTSENSIALSVDANGKEQVILTFIKKDNKILAIEAYKMGEEDFTFSFYLSEEDMKSEVEQSFDIAVLSNMNRVDKNVRYLGTLLRNNVLDAINTAKDSENIKNAIEPCRLGLNLSADDFNDEECQIIYEQRPYDKIDDVLNTLKSVQVINQNVKLIEWSVVSDFIKDNSKIVLYDVDELSYYNKLSSKQKIKYNQIMCRNGNFTSILNFRQKFVESHKKYINEIQIENEKSQSNFDGGGKKAVSVSNNTNSTSIPSGNGNSATKKYFNDLDEAAWAKEAIDKLSENGVVNGYPDGSFKPNAAVKREEFATMIVKAFNISQNENAMNFSDCVKGEWYTTFVASLGTLNIVVGDDNGCFGIGNDITREDAAVILWRTMNHINKKINAENKEVNFEDSDIISDYAKEAVTMLAKLGVINGKGNNRFAPKEPINRAESAKLIYTLSELVTEG